MNYLADLNQTLRKTRYNIAANARHYRLQLGLSRHELAAVKGVHYRLFETVEDPTGPNLRLDTLAKVALLLEVPVWALLAERDLPEMRVGQDQRNLLLAQRKTKFAPDR